MSNPSPAGTQSFCKPLFDQIPREKRESVLEAAASEFAQSGFALATMSGIARRAGVSVGSLYQYFTDKEALYLMVVHQGFLLIEEAVRPVVEGNHSLTEILDGLVEAVFTQTASHRTMTRLYLRFTTEDDPGRSGRLAAMLEGMTAGSYVSLIRRARESGMIPSGIDDRVLAFSMDNLFLMLQFSLAGGYYRERMCLYMGTDAAEDPEFLKASMKTLLRRILGMPEGASA